MIKHSFSNKYGMALVDAIFMINTARLIKNDELTISIDLNDDAARTSAEHMNSNIQYDAVYWINQAAKDAGSQPMQYEQQGVSNDPAMLNGIQYSFPVDSGTVIETAEQLEAECEAHFKKNILEIEA